MSIILRHVLKWTYLDAFTINVDNFFSEIHSDCCLSFKRKPSLAKPEGQTGLPYTRVANYNNLEHSLLMW